MGELEGKVLAFLGRGNDLDRALCVAAAEAGADVAFGTVSPADEFRVASIANEVWSIGTRQFVMTMDATDPTAMAAFAARAFDELGGCHLAVASTWLESESPFAELSADEWGPVVSADLTIPYLFVEAFSKEMGRQGKGVMAIVAPERSSADAAERAARAGIVSLTADANAALAPEGLRVAISTPDPAKLLALFP